MAVNLAQKHEKKIDERFKLKNLTEPAVNHDYSWDGVNAITIYSVPTAAMNNYTKSGTSRYGTAAELDNTVQTLTLTKDRSFTFTIDRGNKQDTQGVQDAGKALGRQIDEVIVPEVDSYRLSVMSAAGIAAGGTATAALDASTAYKALLTAGEYMSDNKVPLAGRMAFITPAYYSLIKLDNSFIKASEIAQNALIKGQIGEVDGVKLIVVPSSYFPAKHNFIMTQQIATVAANKLTDYKIHDNPPGINGWLVEGRVRYDAFVLNNKNKAIYVHKSV